MRRWYLNENFSVEKGKSLERSDREVFRYRQQQMGKCLLMRKQERTECIIGRAKGLV